MWLLRVKYFGTACNDGQGLVIVKTNVFFINSSGNRFDEFLHTNTGVRPHIDNLRDAVVNEKCMQFISITNSPAQYIYVRPFCFQCYGLGINAAYCRLSLEPLEGKPPSNQSANKEILKCTIGGSDDKFAPYPWQT